MKLPRYILLTVTNPKGVEVKIERKELVTCKDCIHWDNVDNEYCCRLDVLGMESDDFCSLGKRREDE